MGPKEQRLRERPLSVALVQSEAEVLHTPAFDLSAFLASDPARWHLQLFTDRNFEGLTETAGQYDCLVLGFNVLHQTKELVRTLKASLPETGILVLHQLSAEALDFLPSDLSVRVAPFSATEERVVVPTHVQPDDEVLLRWPARVDTIEDAGDHVLDGYTLCHLEGARDDRWRRFFEVERGDQRFVVGLRTPRTRAPGIVLCNLWLEPSRESHAALLTNMIRYCARGIPDVAVLTPGDDERLDLLARKVELQGVKVVHLPAKDDPAQFADWPLRNVGRAVVVEDCEVDPAWQQRGGVIVRVANDGELSLRGGTSDQHWVAERWAAWFSSIPSARWHGGTVDGEKARGSIFQSRAILRMLRWVADQPPKVVRSLSLPLPETFAPYLGALIAPRLDADGGVEGTISSTAAAWDIHQLTGATALTDKTADRVEKWLRNEFRGTRHMSIADRLDIARALRDYGFLEESVELLRRESQSAESYTPPGARVLPGAHIALSPMIVTRLRQTCLALSDEELPGHAELAALMQNLEEDDGPELSTNLLLAAEYLDAAVSFESRFGDRSPPLLDPERGLADDNVELAIGALSKFGRLVRTDEWTGEPAALQGEPVSTEALALIAYFGKQPPEAARRRSGITNTHFITPRSRGLPAMAVNQLIGEVQKSRKAFVAVDQERTRLTDEVQKRERLLARARNILGVLSLALALLSIYAWSKVHGDGLVWLEDVTGTLLYLSVPAVVFSVAALILVRLDLAPRWLERPAAAALEMAPGPLKSILSAMQRKKPDPPANA